jgi:hypothetical protein
VRANIARQVVTAQKPGDARAKADVHDRGELVRLLLQEPKDGTYPIKSMIELFRFSVQGRIAP